MNQVEKRIHGCMRERSKMSEHGHPVTVAIMSKASRPRA
jgi:hypothetical protein